MSSSSGQKNIIIVDDAEVRKMLLTAKGPILKNLNQLLDDSAIEASKQIKLEAPIGVTGQLKQTRTVRRTLERIIGSRGNYSRWVEEGTKPHWTSVKNLESWARLKGISPYAVQKSIALKGTKANPYITRAYKKSEGRIKALATRRLTQMVKDVAR